MAKPWWIRATDPTFNGQPMNVRIEVYVSSSMFPSEAREVLDELKKAIELAEERQSAYDAKLTEFQARSKEAKSTCDCHTCGTRRR